MAHSDRDRPYFYELNWLGKAVYLGGAALRLSANLIDQTVERASVIIDESRAAYLREVDPNIEDAIILEEREDRPGRHRA